MPLHGGWFEHKVPDAALPASPIDIRQRIRLLVSDVIDSFEKLEIVLYLHRLGYPAVQEDVDIAKAISIPVEEVTKCLTVLKGAGVLDPQGTWADAVTALANMYEDDRIEVMNLMTQTSLERVRKQAAVVFADAFVIRPKKKRDPDG